MARGSFQDEVPKSRVNIKYVKRTDGAAEEVELPLKLLMVGDYTMREDNTGVEDRKRISVTRDNFNDVMKEQKLNLNFSVKNVLSEDPDAMLNVDLDFESMKHFNPEHIARQIPELATMLEVRNLLKDLRGRVVNNADFRRKLASVIKDPDKLKSLEDQLDNIAPLGKNQASEE